MCVYVCVCAGLYVCVSERDRERDTSKSDNEVMDVFFKHNYNLFNTATQ